MLKINIAGIDSTYGPMATKNSKGSNSWHGYEMVDDHNPLRGHGRNVTILEIVMTWSKSHVPLQDATEGSQLFDIIKESQFFWKPFEITRILL